MRPSSASPPRGAQRSRSLTASRTAPTELAPGAYSVSETVPGGWDQLSVVCSSSLGDTEVETALELDAGETITCVFANQADANIVVTKVTEPVGDPTLFDFTSNYGADLLS